MFVVPGERGQDILPQNMPIWHTGYFEPVIFRKD